MMSVEEFPKFLTFPILLYCRVDYSRMGEEYAALDLVPGEQSLDTAPKKSHLQCLFLELELGLVAVSTCVGVDCMVIAICSPGAPLGNVKAVLQATTEYVQEALSPLSETTYR